MRIFRLVLLVIGFLLIADTLIVSTLSNFNLGVVLPAFFGIPMVLIAILLPQMKTGILCILKWAAAAGYAIAGIIFLVCGILMASAAKPASSVEADAVIVLGAAVHGEKVTWVLSNRLDTAADYLNSHPDAIAVVSGGQGNGEDIPEGIAMKKYLMERRGIAEERILTEAEATNTRENFAFSKELIDREIGTDAKVAFVTTDFHVFRAGKVAKTTGLDAIGMAAPDVWYIRINNFMRECIGICVYAIRGDI
ncbi:MAG: YdcF family protein [Lachnospiraceae bacterium]|nr:YdcF family protein [Lachnospiraceae bacterium]